MNLSSMSEGEATVPFKKQVPLKTRVFPYILGYLLGNAEKGIITKRIQITRLGDLNVSCIFLGFSEKLRLTEITNNNFTVYFSIKDKASLEYDIEKILELAFDCEPISDDELLEELSNLPNIKSATVINLEVN